MQYIKNVTNQEHKMAYMDCEGIFRLHFNHQPNEGRIKVGENILLCQRFGEKNDRIFSHLVVIIDKTVYPIDNQEEYNRYIYVKLIAKGNHLINETKYWKDIEVGGYTSGKLINVDNIGQAKNDPILKENLEKEAWGLFFPEPNKNVKVSLLGHL